jgi:transposase-like protein
MGYLLRMATKGRAPRTLLDAVRYFKDAQTCIDFLAAIRWPNGVVCPTCGNEKVGYLANQQRWQCSKKHPKRQFSVKVGTIFEDSPIGLEKWLPAMWLIVSCKNGISSYELARNIDVTQQTAWFMLHRLRLAMQESGGKARWPRIEGGSRRDLHRWDRAEDEQPAARQGDDSGEGREPLNERQADRARDAGASWPGPPEAHRAHRPATLLSEVESHVETGSEVHTDELSGYGLVGDSEYAHKIVNHAET